MAVPPAAAASEWERRALDRSLGSARDRSSMRARQLVEAARELAVQRSSAEFTVAEVADRAGVALRTFYRHFAGRDELLLALFEEEARQGAELLREAVGATSEPLERVRRYVVELCRLLATGSGYASLLVREHLRLGQSHPAELQAALAPLIDLLEAELGTAADAGLVRPVDHHDTVVVFTSVLAYEHASVLLADGDDTAGAAERLWQFCRAALQPPEPVEGGPR